MEQTVRTKQKNAIAGLEAKLNSLEEQLETESRLALLYNASEAKVN